MSNSENDPLLIDLDEETSAPSPSEAPVISDLPEGRAMQAATTLAARSRSILGAWFWRLLLALLAFFTSLAAWEAITALLNRAPVLGLVATGLLASFMVVCLLISIREIAALSRLAKVETLQGEAARILSEEDVEGARRYMERLGKFYAGRAETAWGRDRMAQQSDEIFDAKTGLSVVEDALLAPLDAEAARVVEAATRQVATVTALVPLALADVIAALTANVRMIRRIAEIYGGRAGTFGAWRLMRAVAAHLVATGAVAVGDDLLGSLGGGHVLGKLSRRFGEGMVNGALTARVGVAAMEVCRPMPFVAAEKPKVTGLLRRAVTGLFDAPT